MHPFNSLDAFREAVRQGADGCELDVRRSGDHAMVVHHDAQLADGRALRSLTVADLPPDVALLGAALDALDGLIVNIEIKNVPIDADHDANEFLAGAVADLVNDRGIEDRVIVSSFSLATINRVAQVDPDIKRGFLASPRADPMDCLRHAIEGGHQALHPHHVATGPELVKAAHDAGLAVNVWTVDDPDRIRWLAEIGVDAVITNTPDVAIAALQRG